MWRVILFAVVLAVTGCRKAPLADDPKRPLRVGMELAYPPFEMTDEAGKPTGISVDLANALGEFLQRKVEIQNLAFDGLIPSLQTGKIDLIISSLTMTEGRKEAIDFSEPYLNTGLALLCSKKSGVRKIGDVVEQNGIVAVKKGTTGYLYGADHFPKNLVVLDKESACVLEVSQNSVDAFIYDQLSVLRNFQANPYTTVATLESFQKEQWAMGLRKGNDALRTQVNAFMAKFKQEGGFGRLGDKYLLKEKTAFAERGVPFVF